MSIFRCQPQARLAITITLAGPMALLLTEIAGVFLPLYNASRYLKVAFTLIMTLKLWSLVNLPNPLFLIALIKQCIYDLS